ncbi:hypothetical protein CPC16_009587 [Podila verticillata]|nr:hypothetical protein BGZ52_000620 [Haplosporangium bisporale]KAF9210725.1 hypothetical protein BGZ59_009060 [Podila verticillata]KAF9381985.1 hypothetical protein CPC16_009587 [Podila verticillata]KAI9233350.1 MAG: hypothetical protein BYD32DRAFT_426152 [Podila humilis]KFH68161.1 hypothetical protein MVEG_06890 [Podila verticillata NRRL 6337]
MTSFRVFIIGATGYIGSTVMDLLLKESAKSRHTFRALVRSPEKAEDVRSIGIEPVLGSLDDSELLEKEASHADIVLSFANSDDLGSVQAILKGLQHRPRPENGRKRPILIHTSGTGVLLDGAYGNHGSQTIYYDNDVAQLSTLGPQQPHRIVDQEIMSPKLKGQVDTYIVVPPATWGFGTRPGSLSHNHVSLMVESSLKHKQAVQVGKGLNYWSKVHVVDLAVFYIHLFGRALKEPQDDTSNAGQSQAPLPKNEDAYYFVQEGDDIQWGEVAQEIAKHFQQLAINNSGLVKGTSPEEEAVYWEPGMGGYLGGNSRSRAVKGRELLAWEPKYTDFKSYVGEEIQCQLRVQH